MFLKSVNCYCNFYLRHILVSHWLENLKNVLTTSISKAYLNLKLNEEKIISSIKEIESSKESVRLSRLRYDVGISTLKDVLVRQSELSNAKSKLQKQIIKLQKIIMRLRKKI